MPEKPEIKKQEEKRRKAARRRYRLRVLGEFVILVLLVVYVLANINDFVNLPAIHQAIFNALNKSFYGRIDAEDTWANLGEFSAEGWDVSAVDERGREIGRAPYVKIWFNPLSFFWRRVRLERIEMEKPVVHIWTDPDHVFVWKRFKRPPRKLNPIFRTRAGVVIAHDGTFTYDYYPEPMPVHVYLEGINARARFQDKTPHIQGTIDRLYLKYKYFDGWFENLSLQGLIDENYTVVHRLDATYLNVPLQISGQVLGFKMKNPRLDIDISAAGKIGDLLRHFHYEKNPPGEFTMEAKVSGLSDDYYVTGEFHSPYGIIEGQRYDNFHADFVFHESVVNLDSFTMRMYGMYFDGGGWYNVSNGRFHIHGTMTHRGRPMHFDVAGRLDTDNDVMTFTSAEVYSAYARLEGTGKWLVDRGTVEFDYRLIIKNMARELAHWGVRDFAGSLDVSGEFSGPITDPYVTADGRVSGLEWKRAELGSGSVSAVLEDGDISGKLKNKAGKADFTASVHVPLLRKGDFVSLKKMPFSFEMKTSGFRITKRLMQTDFTGTADGFLIGEGTTRNLSASGEIFLKNVNAWGQSVASAHANLAMNENGVSFQDIRLTLPSGDKGSGKLWVDWNLNYDLSLESDRLRLSSLNQVVESGHPVEGELSVKAHGKGSFEKVRIEALADFRSLTYDTLDLVGGEMNILLQGTMTTVEGNVYNNTSISGSYDLDDGTFHDFTVIFEDTPLDPIFKWKKMDNSTGSITGSLKLNGGAKGWGDVDYAVLLSDVNLDLSGKKISNEGDLRLEIGPSGGVEDVHLVFDNGRIDITGTLSASQVWDLEIVGNLDLGILETFTHQVKNAAGMLSINLKLKGPSKGIKLAGIAELENGGARFRGYSPEFSKVSGRLFFNPDQIVVDRLAGNVGDDGDFSVGGLIYYKGFSFTQFDLNIEATNLPFSKPGEYKIVLSPSLKLTGETEHLKLEGKLQIVDGRYIKDVRIERQFVEIQRETTPPREVPGWLKNLDLNIRIIDDGNFRINNNFADLYIQSDLLIKGKPDSFTIDGDIDGVEGKIFYGGTAFDLQRATVIFAEEETIDPEVDLFANTEIRTYEIRLYLKGRLSHMQLTLESAPPLDDQNILSLITFHKLADELGQNEMEALMALPIFLQQQFGGSVREPLKGWSGLSLQGIEAQENSPGYRVIIGYEVSKRLMILYSAETSGVTPVRETQAIYKITDTIWLQGTQNNQGVYSFKLNFHFQFE